MPRAQQQVRELMLRLPDWRVVQTRQVERGTVADVARLFTVAGLTQMPVVEADGQAGQRPRGLLSAARVRRLLSVPGNPGA